MCEEKLNGVDTEMVPVPFFKSFPFNRNFPIGRSGR